MVNSLIRNWWAVGLVGVLAVMVGAVAFSMPLTTLASLVYAFAAYALLSGVVQVAAGLSGEGLSSRGWLIAGGVLSIIAGGVTLFWPGISAVALYTLIATWAILAGITQVVAALALRDHIRDTWLVALAGVVMAVFGAYLLARPTGGVLALAYAFGTYAMTYGVAMIAGSVMLKRVKDMSGVTIAKAEQPTGVRSEETTRR